MNFYIVFCMMFFGGYLFWFEIGGGRWYFKLICNFLNVMVMDINLEVVSREEKMVGDGKY